MIFNRELEALAIDKNGTIFILPENPAFGLIKFHFTLSTMACGR
jgi:hypothetical protein